MRRTTTIWTPAAIGVGEYNDESGVHALVIDDDLAGFDRTVIHMTDGDARRIGAALLGVEIPDAVDDQELEHAGGEPS